MSDKTPAGPAPRNPGIRPALPPRETLAKEQRLRRKADFDAVYATQRRRVGRHMVLWAAPRTDRAIRLGVVASRKVGPSVDRSRAKRRLREMFRRHRARLSGGWDIVLVARRPLIDAPWNEIVNEMLRLARKSGLFQNERNA